MNCNQLFRVKLLDKLTRYLEEKLICLDKRTMQKMDTEGQAQWYIPVIPTT